MLRQTAECVSQGKATEGTLINTKKEWNYIHLPRVIIGDGEGTSMGPRVVSFASVGAETKVLASFLSAILPILHEIYCQRSIMVISSRFLLRVAPVSYRHCV